VQNIFKLYNFLDPSLKLSSFLLIILILLNALAESLSIALIVPITVFLFENDLINKYPDFFFLIEFFSPFKYVVKEYSQKTLIISGLLILFCFLIILRIIFNLLFLYFKSSLQLKIRYLVSKKLMNGYFTAPADVFANKNNSRFVFSAVLEAGHVTTCVGLVFVLLAEFFVILSIFILLVIYQTKMTLILSSIIFISSYIFLVFFKKKINLFAKKRKELEADNLSKANQMFDGLMEIKSYKVSDFFLADYLKNLKTYLANLRFAEVLPFLPRLWLEFVALISVTFLLVHMIKNDFSQSLIISTLGLYIAATFRIMPSINKIINAIQSIKYFEPMIESLTLDNALIDDNKDFSNLNSETVKMKSKIALSDISYGYNNTKLILENLSLTINKNQKIGISGESGCGKSTLIKILAGLLKPNSGKILIDNNFDLKNNYLNLNNNISLVPQNIFINNDTIKNNIAFGVTKEKIDNEKIMRCIKTVQLDAMVNSLNDGINHKILERGKNLSGGQIQRIGIARALYYEPDIIIFDESTSSLDEENEKKILNLIEEISSNKTIIFVSHRKEVLAFCDIIYYMKNKKIYV